MGRPTDYKVEYNEQAYKLCLLGATDESLANFFDVCTSTIDNWKNEYPEFLGAIKNGKEVADAEVAHSLYKRATGCTVKETHISGGGDDDEAPAAKEITKELPPDTGAAFIWLKNRAGWKDKQEVKSEIEGGIKVTWDDSGDDAG